ncbi:MAG TPA: hypothetical protein VGM44_24590 [Polyangiaceae bacterium]
MNEEEAARSPNAPTGRRGVAAIFRRLPWFTAAALFVALASLAVLVIGNEARVAVSYHAQTPARDVAYARYEALEDVAAAIMRWSTLLLVLPSLLLQIFSWPFLRRLIGEDRRTVMALVLSTIVGIVFIAFMALICSVAISASMVG